MADYEVELRIPAESGGEAPQGESAECRRGRRSTLLAGEELSEEFKDEAKTIFEACTGTSKRNPRKTGCSNARDDFGRSRTLQDRTSGKS